MNNNALIIFIKNPEIGKVKTRLSKGVGDQQALEIYEQLLEHTHEVTKSLDCTKYLFYSNYINDNDIWNPQDFLKSLQRGADLGERMMDAFLEILSFHKKVVIIGSDCIYLNSEHISKAFVALDTKDVVMGPTFDGGYYLMGMKKCHTSLFIGIPWSSGKEYAVSRERILSSSLSLHNIEKLDDIDNIDDWNRYLDSKK